MTRTMHDSFAKEWMQELLTDFGEVEIEKQIAGEVRKIDVYFCPNPTALESLKAFGLLGRMLSKPMLMEPFRNAAIEWDVRNSREKVFQLEGELTREAKRKMSILEGRSSTHVDFDANIFACAPKRIGRSRDAIVGKRDLFSSADRSDRRGRDSSIAEDDRYAVFEAVGARYGAGRRRK